MISAGNVCGLVLTASVYAATAVFAQANGGVGADWITVDEAQRIVTLDIVAGMTEDNVRWNFNGFFKGTGKLTIPSGYRVIIEFSNADPSVPHSIGVGAVQDPFPPMFSDPQPLFEGAMSSNSTSMTDATMPGESETIEFALDRPGSFALICYVPAHAVTGMWIRLEVSDSGGVEFDPGD